MPSNVLMPKTGADATEAKLIRWLKKEGDTVSRGEAVAEIETEKVNMEVEAFNPGILFRILAPEGTTLPVGEPIAILLKEGEAPPADAPAPTPATAASAAPAAQAGSPSSAAPPDQPVRETPGPPAGEAAPPPTPPAPAGLVASAAPSTTAAPAGATLTNGSNGHDGDGRIKASPIARRLAQEHNLDLARISGRGPGGRVVKEDVEAAIQAGVAAPAPAPAPSTPTVAPAPAPAPAAPAATPGEVPAGVTVRDLSRIQLTTGRRLAESKQLAPHFYLTVEVDMAEALKLRATLNEQAAGSVKISVNDLVIKAATWALGRHRNLNASFRDGKLLLFDRVNISMAVPIEEGLVSPVLPDADRKSLGQIARESRALIERARGGKLRPEDLSDGTFTVSNLGTPQYDIDSFVAIINPPQAAILAVGAVRQVPVVRNGEIVIGQVMKATLSVDHRAADGAQGAEFLSDVRRALEAPLLMAL